MRDSLWGDALFVDFGAHLWEDLESPRLALGHGNVRIAIAMLTSGYRRHRRKWIIATGSLGILLVVIGSILPYIETSPKASLAATETKPAEEEVFTYVVGESDKVKASDDDVFVYVKGEEMPETSCGSGCTDNCCPSLVRDANGKIRLNIPPASVVTTLGGLSLIITHVGNLCCCPACRRRKE